MLDSDKARRYSPPGYLCATCVQPIETAEWEACTAGVSQASRYAAVLGQRLRQSGRPRKKMCGGEAGTYVMLRIAIRVLCRTRSVRVHLTPPWSIKAKTVSKGVCRM